MNENTREPPPSAADAYPDEVRSRAMEEVATLHDALAPPISAFADLRRTFEAAISHFTIGSAGHPQAVLAPLQRVRKYFLAAPACLPAPEGCSVADACQSGTSWRPMLPSGVRLLIQREVPHNPRGQDLRAKFRTKSTHGAGS